MDMKIAHKVPPPGHPAVLNMEMIAAGFGGQETHVINLYKLLSDRGVGRFFSSWPAHHSTGKSSRRAFAAT